MTRRKVFVVCKESAMLHSAVAVFASEGDAEQSADKHRDNQTKTWVEEVNYYE